MREIRYRVLLDRHTYNAATLQNFKTFVEEAESFDIPLTSSVVWEPDNYTVAPESRRMMVERVELVQSEADRAVDESARRIRVAVAKAEFDAAVADLDA